MGKKLAIASDHAGYALKIQIKKHLDEKNVPYIDFGTNDTNSCHYPEYAHKLCEAIAKGECERGLLICGTGIGMSMSANKHKGIRAACCSDSFSARATRAHNDANVLCLGERVVGPGLACELVDIFLSTEFEGGRHSERVKMINGFDEGL